MNKTMIKKTVSILLLIAVVASVAVLAGCGAKEIKVPDVIGMTKADAEKAITDLGLTMTVQRERYSDTVAAGSIEDMITAAGTVVEPKSEVRVITSLGEGRTVPNVGVLTGKEAENLIKKVGLNPVIVEEYSDEVEEGNVISYTDGGQIIPKGGDVTVTVSKGPEKK